MRPAVVTLTAIHLHADRRQPGRRPYDTRPLPAGAGWRPLFHLRHGSGQAPLSETVPQNIAINSEASILIFHDG